MSKVNWRFFRAGGVDQVHIGTGAELAGLRQLDQKLWVALSCPVNGLEFDERTLALIDADKDGRVRAPELIAAVEWAAAQLNDVEQLAKASSSLPLAAIATGSPEGQLLRATAETLLKAIGKAGAAEISVDDVTAALTAFNNEAENGDGVIPVAAAGEAGPLVAELLGVTAAPPVDRSGAPGLDAGANDAFFAAASAHLQWLEAGKAPEVLPLGEATAAAFDAMHAVTAKVDDYFSRCRIASFDPRALGAMNRDEAAYGALATVDLSAAVGELAGFPLAHIEADADLRGELVERGRRQAKKFSPLAYDERLRQLYEKF